MKLHIGSIEKKEGWKTFDVKEGADYVGDAKDMSRFENETFDEIYASHVLEHFDYKDSLGQALKEWHRVLKPDGKLYISVPDMKVLCDLFLRGENAQTRFSILRMILGGHCDKNDYHYTGFDTEILGHFLNLVGFKRMKKVDVFGIFEDTSNLRAGNTLISLNVIAFKEIEDIVQPLETSL